MLFFLLSNGEQLLNRCADAFKDGNDRLRALRIARDAQLQMSRYPVTAAVVNSSVGLRLGVGRASANPAAGDLPTLQPLETPRPYSWRYE